jgi:hypothetical protein
MDTDAHGSDPWISGLLDKWVEANREIREIREGKLSPRMTQIFANYQWTDFMEEGKRHA